MNYIRTREIILAFLRRFVFPSNPEKKPLSGARSQFHRVVVWLREACVAVVVVVALQQLDQSEGVCISTEMIISWTSTSDVCGTIQNEILSA